MRIMVALGGNALLERGEKPDAAIQRHHVRRAAQALAPIAADHQLIICHGNGPQIGVLSLESETDTTLTRPFPLDVLVVQTQGMIGYWLAQELHNAGLRQPVIAVVTQTVVDAADPAFATPTKFIGPTYTSDRAQQLAEQHGWSVAADGATWRRVVASPQPQRILEHDTIRHLVDNRVIVICGGGGGAPVIEDSAGQLTGVEAVVDKDFVAARIAVDTAAERLLLLTDVPAVIRDFGTPHATALHHLTITEAAGLHAAAGSVGPKIDACIRYATTTGHPATIGALTDAPALLAGTTGTTITNTSSSINNHSAGQPTAAVSDRSSR